MAHSTTGGKNPRRKKTTDFFNMMGQERRCAASFPERRPLSRKAQALIIHDKK